MASYNHQAGGNDQNNNHFNSLLARLNSERNNASDVSNGREPQSWNFGSGSQSQGYHAHQSQGQDSPLMTGSDVFPPPAPTPPMSHFSHSHHPPGLMSNSNLGAIGTMPSSGDKSNQSAALLNLLRAQHQKRGNGSSHSHTGSQSSLASQHQATPLGATMSGQNHLLNHPNISNIPTLHAPVPMPADPQGVLASLIKGDGNHENARSETQPASDTPGKWNAAPPPEDTQAYLLNLLQRPKPSQNDQPPAHELSQLPNMTLQSPNHSTANQMKDFHLKQDLTDKTPHDDTQSSCSFNEQSNGLPPASAAFDYTSPPSKNQSMSRSGSGRFKLFGDNPPSPHNRTLKSSGTPNVSETIFDPAHISILKKAAGSKFPRGTLMSPENKNTSPEYKKRKLESPDFDPDRVQGNPQQEASLDKNKETVSEAMEDLAETADREAQEALTRAENEEVQAKLAMDLNDMVEARTDAEFQEKSEIAARHMKEELDKDENAGVLEKSYDPNVAQAIRNIVNEAANGHVADSWESAEADEIIVFEETPAPVDVYNFPMKPWISITLQDVEKARPQFRDEVILDIARIKKEFDQIDRNLVSATVTYIVYGMSKAGGLRIIRQDDGCDAGIFTNTKDRIFNVAVSTTPPDSNATPKESFIGTGISGTVYYVLIREGDKDYIEDSHLEQYGFALPPVSTQEGDAPGGVLKTRARTSSTHPDYFAVGRGKTINIIWPSYIMKHNLFKAGHDRVVDTEKLAAQCSLRINTGKAGKDFTFSQDDTTIVSLDKSGRVKFWDIRDLTSADEGSDPRLPMPARTELEVKEPLMTLTTTPEGEKAWPTSVLLLDKQRPYQRRCALRYMIVGMKQNHTLQLWDLALGKPVQEFNLPHSKESDAVCSVMYHPPTGMIVVGHPTRNSIYFLHLSAPKYTIKGLSQVDYVKRLVAKDSSIPEPESTAVISGVREYSFANKGIIRSLDMVTNPEVKDDEEPTLFDLYAMHSKGVAMISIKQAELGWTKDNKVVSPVDGVETGIVKINKLKELPQPQLLSESQAVEETTLPIRIASRSTPKDNNPLSHEDTLKKTPEESNLSLPITHTQPKFGAEAPITPINQLDKTERKARKKREKAAASAAAAAEKLSSTERLQANGSSNSSQLNAASTKADHKASAPSQSTLSNDAIMSVVKHLESSLTKSVEVALQDHRRQLDSELRSRDAGFNKSQQKLLDLVSTTLDSNVQNVLTRTINDKVEDSVLPALSDVIEKAVTECLDTKIGGRVSHAVQNQMQRLLPVAISQALQKPELAQAFNDKIVKNLATNVEKSFIDALHTTITPAFSEMAVAAASDIVNDVQTQAAEQVEALQQKLDIETAKIDQLTALVTRLSDTVTAMATTQARFQDGFLKMQQQTSRDRQASNTSFSQMNQVSTYPAPPPHSQYASPSAHSNNQLMPYQTSMGSNRDQEFERRIVEIQAQIQRGEVEGALVRWLQSEDLKREIFKQYLSKLNIQLSELSPLVSLAVIAELARDLEAGELLREKIYWMDVIIASLHNSIHQFDGQVKEVVPGILSTFVENVEKVFTKISKRNYNDPSLKFLSQLNSVAIKIMDAARAQQAPASMRLNTASY